MQPPPRKAKAATILRNLHNEQINKLQTKHQQDSEILDDIRNFTKVRAAIEKEYGQALLKLATSHLQKKVPNYTEFKDDGEDQRTVYTVWRTLLDETEKIGKARLAAAEVYHQQISESAKVLRTTKLQTAKKCFENIRRMQDELQQAVQELDKTKKLYFEEEHMAHDAREKAHDADEKLKRKKGRIFQSISSLQKNSTKFSFRREACDIQATKARNDYILALVAANAHQSKFYEIDLPEVLQNLDCDIYEKIQEYLQLMCRTELLTCVACNTSYTIVQEQADSITRQYTIECFLQDNPVLAQSVHYNFDPCDNDPLDKISLEHNAALCLSKEAKKWCTCITKEKRTLRANWQELSKLQALLQEKVPEQSLAADQVHPHTEIEAKIDDIKNIIRKAETSKLKAEARIEVLREGGVNVEEFMISDVDSLGPYDTTGDSVSRSGTLSSKGSRKSTKSVAESEPNYEAANSDSFYDSDNNEEVGNTSAPFVEEPREEPAFFPPSEDILAAVQIAWDEAPVEDSNLDSGTFAPAEATYDKKIKCVALFTYEATNPDELSFVEQEELEIISDGDGDGWIKARNYRNEEGYIPQNYVEISEVQTSAEPVHQSSFSSVDYTIPGEDGEAAVISETLNESDQTEDSAPELYCHALYDYEATCDEELSFFEGQIIRLISKEVNDVDDGWWQGEINGQVGIFPSLVVDELRPGVSQEVTSPGCAPPAFTPPKPQFLLPPSQVILTQPTPEVESLPDLTTAIEPPQETETSPPNNTNASASVLYHGDNDFQMELSKDQQELYQAHQSETLEESSDIQEEVSKEETDFPAPPSNGVEDENEEKVKITLTEAEPVEDEDEMEAEQQPDVSKKAEPEDKENKATAVDFTEDHSSKKDENKNNEKEVVVESIELDIYPDVQSKEAVTNPPSHPEESIDIKETTRKEDPSH